MQARQQQVVARELEWLPSAWVQDRNAGPEFRRKDRRRIVASSYRQLLSFVSWQQCSEARFSEGGRSGSRAFHFQPLFSGRELSGAAQSGILDALNHWAAMNPEP